MSLTGTFEIPTHVAARRVGEETVIIDLEGGSYFGLDSVGARIWELIGRGMDLADVRDTLLSEYDVTVDRLEGDLLKLIDELTARRLVARLR
jgi:hypothetical protein